MILTATASHPHKSSRYRTRDAHDLDVSLEVATSGQAVLLLVGKISLSVHGDRAEVYGGQDSPIGYWLSDELLTDLHVLEAQDFDRAVVELRRAALAKCGERVAS